MAKALVSDVYPLAGLGARAEAPLLGPDALARPQRRVSFEAAAPMLPGSAGPPLLAGFAAGLFSDAQLQHAAQPPPVLVLNGGAGGAPLLGGLPPSSLAQPAAAQQPQPQQAQQQQAQKQQQAQQQQPVSAAVGLQALKLDEDPLEGLGPLPLYGGLAPDDTWGAPPATGGPHASQQQQRSLLLSLSQQLQQQAPGGPGGAAAIQALLLQQQQQQQASGGAPLAPNAPRAPRARRHSMYVQPGHDARASRRSSVGNYDSVALLHQQQQAAAAALAAAGGGGGGFGPISSGRGTPNGGYGGGGGAGQLGLAPASVAERIAALGLGGAAAAAPPPMSLAAPGAPLAAPQWGAVGAAPRAPAAGGSRRHSWCPSTMYYHPQAQLAYRALQQQQGAAAALLAAGGALDAAALAALQQGADAGAGAAPAPAALLGVGVQQPGSPGGGPLGGRKAAGGLAAGLGQYLPGGEAQYLLLNPAAAAAQQPGAVGVAAPAALGDADLLRLCQQYAAATAALDGGGGAIPAELLQAAAAGVVGPLPGAGAGGDLGVLDNLMVLDPSLLVGTPAGDAVADALRARQQQLFADSWDLQQLQQAQAALGLGPPLGGLAPPGARGGAAAALGALGGGAGAKGAAAARGARGGAAAPAVAGVAPAAAAAAAAPTQVQLLPVPEPLSKVCGDAKWELKRSASDSSGALAAVESVSAWLESRRTLEAEKRLQARRDRRAASRAAAAAAAAQQAAAAAGDGAGAGGADAGGGGAGAGDAFAYALPDAGDDTWGASAPAAGGAGSAPAAPARTAAGSGNISSEPSNKLFVGNIGWWVSEEDLYAWFSRYGTITGVKIMYNSRKMHKPKEKWRSREYGFVDYASPAEAARAIVWMDGAELPELMKDGAGIIVQYAKPAGE